MTPQEQREAVAKARRVLPMYLKLRAYERAATRTGTEVEGVMDGKAYVCVTTFRLVGEGNDVVLSALVDGEWFEVIREHVGLVSPISHNAEATVIINKIESALPKGNSTMG